MMKVLYLHQYFKKPSEHGGTRSYDLADSFLKHGINVEVITTTSNSTGFRKGKKWRKEDVNGIIIHYLYLPYDNSFSFAKRAWVFIRFLWYSSLKLLKLRGNVVLATSTPLTIGVPALIKRIFHKTPYIFEVRDVWPEAVIAIGAIRNKLIQRILYALEKLVYKNAVAVVPLSTDMRDSIVSRYPQFEEKSNIVIENISEITRFQNNTDKKIDIGDIVGFKPRFSVLYAGTFGKVNGIHKVIELAEKTLTLDSEVVFILVGSGAEKQSVTLLANERGVLGKNVFILESIVKNELPLWYNAVSMGSSFVIDVPALWANSANKFFDTLASGRPVLINHEGWQADIIRSRNVGYVLPFHITSQAAQTFIDYTRDSVVLYEQGQRALELAHEQYSLERATNKYLEIFRKIEAYKCTNSFSSD